jgi:hypothetical protein
VPPGVGMRNFENGLIDELTYYTWMTDIDLCDPVNWFYREGMGIKDANLIIDLLADVVSKNGIPTGTLHVRSLGSRGRLFAGEIASVDLAGSGAKLKYDHLPTDLAIEMPAGFLGKHAGVFRIQRKE